MRNLLLTIAIALCVVGCQTREERLSKMQPVVAQPNSIVCVSIVIEGFTNDSCVFYNERAFAVDPGCKDSSSVSEKWVRMENDALLRYSNDVDSIAIKRVVFDVYRRANK